jgi:ABC-type lipoprotein export system ATPase subunit
MIVTHDESIAEQCHRTIHMRDGLLEKDEKKEIEKGKVYENLS